VSKVWLQKELILVGFWLSQVGWNDFLCLGRKIGEKVKSWFLSNLGGEWSQMHPDSLSSSTCGFCGGIGGSIHGLWWNKALLRVV